MGKVSQKDKGSLESSDYLIMEIFSSGIKKYFIVYFLKRVLRRLFEIFPVVYIHAVLNLNLIFDLIFQETLDLENPRKYLNLSWKIAWNVGMDLEPIFW